MPLRTTLLVLAIISLIAVGGGGLFLSSQLTNAAWTIARSHTDRTAQMIDTEISYFLKLNHRSSSVLAAIPQIVSVFASQNPGTAEQTNRFLNEYCLNVSATLCYLLDREGTTIASNNYQSSDSLIGLNYGFRPYFQQAIKGLPSTYLALGVTTKKRGFYFSSPIVGENMDHVGVVVVKYPVEMLEQEYSNLHGIFVLLDPNGIVFASNREDWLYHSLTDLSSEEARSIARSRQFGEQQPASVHLVPTADAMLMADDGTSYLIRKQDIALPNGWQIAYLLDTKNVSSHFNNDVADIPVKALFGILFLAIGGIVVLLYNRATAEIMQRRLTENELRDSEEKYRLLFEKSEDPMWVIYDQAFMIANQAAANILGYASADELHKLHPSRLSPPEQANGQSSQQEADRMIKEAYSKGYHRFEWCHVRKNGDLLPVEVSLTRIPFEDHDALFCVWRDISENKRVQRALELARNDAETANRSKSEFLSAMSHEIRTPMTAILGFADMLLDEELPRQNRDLVLRLKGAANALLSLINDILDMSKLEAGKMEVEHIDFDLHELVHNVLTLFERSRKSDRPVDLIVQFSDDFPLTMKSDPTRIRQILVNLVGNAQKFTHQGSIVVNGKIIDKHSASAKISISIEDSGIGMSAATQARLFSEFTQADASTSRKYEGSGLGLVICKKLAALLNGDIQLQSQEGVGSKFIVTLPYVAATSEVSPSPMDARVEEHRTGRKLKILVAEDNRVNQLIVGKFMEKLGHQISIVENGIEAVAEQQNNHYDLILMDIRMPEMDGIEATRMIRQLPGDKADIAIIALTADAMKDQAAEYIEAGMNDLVTKPYDRNKLAQAINRVLGEQIHTSV